MHYLSVTQVTLFSEVRNRAGMKGIVIKASGRLKSPSVALNMRFQGRFFSSHSVTSSSSKFQKPQIYTS